MREPDDYPPLSSDPLTVNTERFLDTDQDEEGGASSYYYSGIHFTFTHGSRVAKGRYYDDDPEEFDIYLCPPERFPHARYADPPYRDPFLGEIIGYVRAHEPERNQFKMLCKDGYVPVLPDKLASRTATA